MSSGRDFATALATLSDVSTDPALLPERLARAEAIALAVDGASLSLSFVPGRRLPIGARDLDALRAERLQFVLGDGPCLTAQRERRTVAGTTAQLVDRWPVYAMQLREHTTFTSVLATPLPGPLAAVGALDLYARGPRDTTDLADDDVQAVAALIGDALAAEPNGPSERHLGLPTWLAGSLVADRQLVWLAVGHLTGQTGRTSSDAPAELRSHAFRHDLDLETAAIQVLADELPRQ